MIADAYCYEFSSRGFFSQVGSDMTQWRSANQDVLNLGQVTGIYYYTPWVSESCYPAHRDKFFSDYGKAFP